MKGDYDGFAEGGGGNGSDDVDNPVNGIDYNTAGSTKVKDVKYVQTVSDAHFMPLESVPDSVIRNFKDGKIHNERYYGSDGKPYLDIDYTDHGNPKMHPHVPHQHEITFEDGKMKRKKSDGRIE